MSNSLRAVTRTKCATCGGKFKAVRRDATYCSSKCRQRALRARQSSDDVDIEIQQARLAYWDAVRRKAEAAGKSKSQIMTAQAQFVDEHGNVYMGGGDMGGIGEARRLVGQTAPIRSGWCRWGLEAAPAPFVPPGLSRKPT